MHFKNIERAVVSVRKHALHTPLSWEEVREQLCKIIKRDRAEIQFYLGELDDIKELQKTHLREAQAKMDTKKYKTLRKHYVATAEERNEAAALLNVQVDRWPDMVTLSEMQNDPSIVCIRDISSRKRPELQNRPYFVEAVADIGVLAGITQFERARQVEWGPYGEQVIALIATIARVPIVKLLKYGEDSENDAQK